MLNLQVPYIATNTVETLEQLSNLTFACLCILILLLVGEIYIIYKIAFDNYNDN